MKNEISVAHLMNYYCQKLRRFASFHFLVFNFSSFGCFVMNWWWELHHEHNAHNKFNCSLGSLDILGSAVDYEEV